MTDDYHHHLDDLDLDNPKVSRKVPLKAWIAVRFSHPISFMGWLFFGLGMTFVWGFGGNADLSGWTTFSGELETAAGKVVTCQETGMSENKSTINKIQYEFVAPDETVLKGTSYGHATFKPGDRVTIEYPPDDPVTSRIQGMRVKPFGPAVLFVAIFPVVGWILVMVSWFLASKNLQLLEKGILTRGKLISKEPTNTRINNQRVYKFTFAFTDQDGQPQTATAKTHKVEKLTDEEEELLIYDPARPYRSNAIDAMPGGLKVDPVSNEILPPSAVRVILPACLVLLVIFGHGLYLLTRFFG